MAGAELRAFPEIDGIRGVLSLIVLFGHLLIVLRWPQHTLPGEGPFFWYWGTMEVFFCISGFLITRNLLRASASKPHWAKNYLMKRALRIWPAYYAALIAAVLVSTFIPPPPAPDSLVWNRDWGYLLKTIFFLQCTEFYVGGTAHGMVPSFAHSWSVAMEEQFYLLILLFIWLRVRTGLFPGMRLLLPLLALMPLSQFLRHLEISSVTLLGRSEGFLLGICLAVAEPAMQTLSGWLSQRGAALRKLFSYSLCALGVLPLIPYFVVHGYWDRIPQLLRIGPINPYFAFSFFAAALLASVVIAPQTAIHRVLRLDVLRYLGTISYSTYLFHVPALFLIYHLVDRAQLPPTWFAATAPVLVIAIASLSYRYIEQPFLRKKKNYS